MNLGVKAARAWDEWEGQVVESKFPLLRHLGGGERSAVFLTERPQGEPKSAAIKIVPADDLRAEAQLARWEASAVLSHPHLIRLFEMGRAGLGGISFAYVLMEYAEEDLSRVDRQLTAVEGADMLGCALNALSYLHGERLAHGHLKPSNIMAVSDQLKISSDAIRPTGEWNGDLDSRQPYDPPEIVDQGATPAGDIWSLGITLVEATTKHRPSWEAGAVNVSLPGDLPDLFRVPVSNCLRRDPRQRWTVADFTRFLERNGEASSLPAPRSARRRYLIPVGAVGLTLAAAALVPRLASRRAAQTQSAIEPAGLRESGINQQPSEAVPPKTEAPELASRVVRKEGVVKQVLPDVPAKARDTIRGKVTVSIRVGVDGDGSVAAAKNETPVSSRFFGNLALQAARQWKFAPADPNPSAHSREWILRFQFVRDSRRPVTVQAIPAR